MTQPTAVILAAGKGTRMKSELPKVLFPVLGRPMIHWVLDALQSAGIQRQIVVIGYRAELVQAEIGQRTGVEFAFQTSQLGTGHAVQMCRENLISADGPILVVTGDSPLIQPSSIEALLREFHAQQYACLLGTLIKENPHGLGRIVRDSQHRFQKIVEQKDATAEEQKICEVNMSTYLFERSSLLWALDNLDNRNAQSEYYLTDCPALLLGAGKKVEAQPVLKPCEALSVNTIDELAGVETMMQELGYRCVN